MADRARRILLDTHVWIWALAGAGRELGVRARAALAEASAAGGVLVSAISVWEVGMLEAKGRVRFSMEVGEWVRRALSAPGVHLAPLTPELALDGARLPGPPGGDAADRILIATARRTGAALLTRDPRILEYGRAGMLPVLDAAS